MSELAATPAPTQRAGMKKLIRLLAVFCAGLMVVAIALDAMSHSTGLFVSREDHALRLLAFSALTVWLTLGMGIAHRGVAAVSSLTFASFIDLILLPSRGEAHGALISANLGIVCAYCGLTLYAWRLAGTHALEWPKRRA